MAEMVAFVPDTHEADLRVLLAAYLEEGAAGAANRRSISSKTFPPPSTA